MWKQLTEQQIQKIVDLYLQGNSLRDVSKITGHAIKTVCHHTKNLPNKRNRKEASILCHKLGKWKCTDKGRDALIRSGHQRCLKTKNYWTKPEQAFASILRSLGMGIKFPDIVKEQIQETDDLNATIYFQYPIQRYLCDFVDVTNKVVYRINGDFWHANPILYEDSKLSKIQIKTRKRDLLCKNYLELHGWNVVDVWESEIKWNIEAVKYKIQQSQNIHTDKTILLDEDWSKKLKKFWIKAPRKKKQTYEKCCRECGCTFLSSFNDRIFCNQECHFKNRRRQRPSKEELKKDIAELNFVALGKKYGISDNGVRGWARDYGLIE